MACAAWLLVAAIVVIAVEPYVAGFVAGFWGTWRAWRRGTK